MAIFLTIFRLFIFKAITSHKVIISFESAVIPLWKTIKCFLLNGLLTSPSQTSVLNNKKEVFTLEDANTPLRRFVFIIFIFFATNAIAQRPEDQIKVTSGILGDSTLLIDSLNAPQDTLQAPVPQSDITTTINYSANDSIKFGVTNRIVYLYGDAKIDYGSIQVEAEQIEIDWATNTVVARGIVDSLGNKIGMPVFHNGTEVYVTKGMTYNFKTGRATISEVVTQQGEGYVHGKEVFKNEDNELFSLGNSYTTCNLVIPHYSIESKRTKAIPDDKIITGPFHLAINQVATPLGFFFGMFPMQKESSSGVIVPSYGEERRRGFFLKGGGYFFDISDYVKTKVTGDLYSKGGHGLNITTQYKRRYKHTGNLNFSYTKINNTDKIEEKSIRNDFQLRWTHTPQSKGSSRFSASVNAATSSYNENNNLGVQQNINRKISSNISYSKTFTGTPFSLGLSARHNQGVGASTTGQANQVSLLLPDLTFNMENVYPFKKKGASSKTWYEKLSVRWGMTGTNQVSNDLDIKASDGTTDSIAPFTFDNLPLFLENSRKGVRHNIPISTSMKMLKYFTLTPSINYSERWYFEKYNWKYDSELQKAVADTISGFNRVSEYSTSVSVSTRIYGTKFFKKGRVKAIRHVINPSLSFSYRPDFGAEKFDYYQEVQNSEDSTVTTFKSRYEGFAYGSPGLGESGSIGLSINNSLEMKMKSKIDSIEQDKKVSLLNSFGLSTSYNIVADSFNLAPISLRANTNLFENKITLSFSGTLDPYQYEITNISDDGVISQRRLERFHWKDHFGIGELSRASIAVSTNLSPRARENEDNRQNRINNSALTEDQKQYLINNPEDYVDFNIPWSLRVNYTLSYSKTGFQPSNTTQGLSFNGDFSLSEKWKITYRSGYDFKNKEFTQTNLGIHRELHCWEMNLDWTPFGRYQSYNFTIRVKSSLLQDLKLNKRRSFQDNIF